MTNSSNLRTCVLAILSILTIGTWTAVVPSTQSLQLSQNVSASIYDLAAARLAGTSCTKPKTGGDAPATPCTNWPIDNQYYLLISDYLPIQSPPQSDFLTTIFFAQASLWADPGATTTAVVPSSYACSKNACRCSTLHGIESCIFVGLEVPATYEIVTKQYAGVVEFMMEQGMSELFWTLQKRNAQGGGDDVTLGYIRTADGYGSGSGAANLTSAAGAGVATA